MNITNNPQENMNFKASLQLRGAVSRLKNEEIKLLKEAAKDIGVLPTDVIQVGIPMADVTTGKVNMAGYVNGRLEMFFGRYENDKLVEAILQGLEFAKNSLFKTPVSVQDKLPMNLIKYVNEYCDKRIAEVFKSKAVNENSLFP